MAAQERGINMMGKPVFLHLNGDSFKRKRIVVNQREMRSFDSFLSAASERFRSPAREIRTPAGRHRIRKLDDLQRDCTYVVMGREPFKNVGYDVKDLRPHRLAPLKEPEVNFLELNHRKYRNVPGKARVSGLRKKEEIKTIVVFCNGIVAKPRRVQLRTDFKMYQVLEAVNDKVSSHSKNGAVYDLYTLDAHRISEPSQLEDNGQYVAVGRERYFDRSVSYNDQGAASQLTPRRASTKPKVTEKKPSNKHRGAAKRTSKKKSLVPNNDEPITSLAADIAARDFNGVNSSPEPVKEEEPTSLFDSFKETVTESLRDDEPQRAYAAAERSDSPHESEIEDVPIEETIQNKVADVLGDNGIPLDNLVDDKQDGSDDAKPSVYEASGHDKEDAKEIQDDKETEEDKPIDQMPAEEVADEEIEAEGSENRANADEEEDGGEVQDEEIEENTEAKDNEKVAQKEGTFVKSQSSFQTVKRPKKGGPRSK
ncbi:doublecortin domain-containing protein 2-like isoform X2 [Oculina patagonica]